MKGDVQAAWEMIRSRTGSESIYRRIGKAVSVVIPSDIAAIEVFDRQGGYAERSWSNADREISRNFDSFLAHRFSHPLFQEFVVSGLRKPTRISDCAATNNFRETGMFREFFKPLGISRQMALALPSGSIGLPVLNIARAGIDFTEQEKDILQQLIPVIRRQIAAESSWGNYDLLIHHLAGAHAAVALVAFHEYIVYSTPRVFELLSRHFSDTMHDRSRLPSRLTALLRAKANDADSSCTLFAETLHATLLVSVSSSENGDQQILSMKEITSPHQRLADRFDLSPRLADVLLLVEQGLSNKEVAAALAISPHTARTMVERLLHRMGCGNRTQAASMARKCIDDVD
jgi:DNA-binding CsgD family transcriptional regulator